jgi:hypothetical protein
MWFVLLFYSVLKIIWICSIQVVRGKNVRMRYRKFVGLIWVHPFKPTVMSNRCSCRILIINYLIKGGAITIFKSWKNWNLRIDSYSFVANRVFFLQLEWKFKVAKEMISAPRIEATHIQWLYLFLRCIQHQSGSWILSWVLILVIIKHTG